MKNLACLTVLSVFASPAVCHPYTLCKSDEIVVFDCVANKKIVSVCLADDSDSSSLKLIYRFGSNRTATPEMVYPQSGIGTFYLSDAGSTKSREERLRFSVSSFDYLVYSGSDVRTGNYAGVAVLKDNKIISKTSCSGLENDEPWPISIPRSLVLKEQPNYNIALHGK